MCPWVSVHFPKYYSDIPRFSKSLLLLLIFFTNAIVNKSYLLTIDHEYDLSILKFISIDMLYNSLFSISISIVCWIFYRHLYRILWLYEQESKYKSSLIEIKNNNQQNLFDKKLYLKNALDELIFDMNKFKEDKVKFESLKTNKDAFIKPCSINRN